MGMVLYNKGYRPLSQLSVLLGVWGGCFLVTIVLTVIITLGSGLPMGDAEALLKLEFRNVLILMQVMNTLCIFGLPAVIFAHICYKNGWAALGAAGKWHWNLALTALGVIVLASPLTDVLGTFNKAIPLPESLKATFDAMEATYEKQVKAILNFESAGGLMASLILVSLLPALFEEFFFRGALQGLLHRWIKNPWVAIGITSLIFSAVHFSWYGFLPRVMLGMALGIVFYISKNIWYSIFMHFINNAAAILYLYSLKLKGQPVSLSQTEVFPVWAGILSFAFMLLLVQRMVKKFMAPAPAEIPYAANAPFN